ncbi:TetR/AcrR family transcriptional regulator [Chryseosolibacter indicus]|uniref:TetR/AcrR family transcriptional regulator n=1 Tax=Chryseosolibacter indicus TaxID=2782351 RepID=A0ABS5VSS9_9BACT|nr:TetR/AcrR family transcriptional regulator [Chryseosolibacter indicus]MBT1704478.1 TetR/AcrR family transcriptional regulator [Chryseosolibacter indicus]
MNATCKTKDKVIREEIISAARSQFQQFGLFKTTMEDIAKAVGKGKSSLYYYFKSKEEIFKAMIREEMEEVFDLVKYAVQRANTAEEKLRAFSSTKIQALHQKASLYGIVFGEISDNPLLVKSLKKDYENKELSLLKDILSFGINNKEFKNVTNDELEHLSYIMLSSIRGIEKGVLEECPIKRISDRLDFAQKLLCHGIKL